MENISCIKEIEQRYNKLTASEKRVADFIVSNHDRIVSMTIGELAEKAGVSKASVVRCCTSLGFRGYPDLKISLVKDNMGIEMTYASYVDPSDQPETIVEKVFRANITTLQNTLRQIDKDIFSQIVDAIAQARIVYIYGIGASGDFARDFQRRLMQIGITAIAYSDSSSAKQSTLNITDRDFVFGVSQSGRTRVVVDTLALARAHGAKTGCMTGYSDSPIVECSDYPLVVTTNNLKYPIDSISARVTQISVFDSLIISLSVKNYDNSMQRITKTNKFVEELRYKKD